VSEHHDFEPVPGLPERLPAGEHILWQGAPRWRSLTRRVFHLRLVTLYFAVMIAWSVASTLADGGGLTHALVSALLSVPMWLAAVALFGLIGWLMARTTVYTVTNRRVVLRIGVALPLNVNLPFSAIEAVDLKTYGDGTGDVSLTLARGQRFAYALAWPHTRPWRFTRPQPTFRNIPDAAAAAEILARALAPTQAQAKAKAKVRTTARPIEHPAAQSGGPGVVAPPPLESAA
jgi:hypothetical protein